MSVDIDDELPESRAIADGWSAFVATLLPHISGAEHAEAHIAFHVGALYVVQIVQQVMEDRSDERASLLLDTLHVELDSFMTTHAIVVQ